MKRPHLTDIGAICFIAKGFSFSQCKADGAALSGRLLPAASSALYFSCLDVVAIIMQAVKQSTRSVLYDQVCVRPVGRGMLNLFFDWPCPL